MPATVYEIDFTSQVAGWIKQLIDVNGPSFPIGDARIETLAEGSRKRRDITFYDRSGAPCLTGEVKLPWAADGYSPYIESTVDDARAKAIRAGVKWFFTWNVNELLLWRLDGAGALGSARDVERFAIGQLQKRADAENPKLIAGIRREVEKFAQHFASVLVGERGIATRAPDIYFIHSLESFLERPIALTKFELNQRYGKARERERLENWMRDRQGWAVGGDQDELLLRAARFTNYTAANRLIFYEALRKRFPALPELDLADHIRTGEKLFDTLRAYFDEAREVTGDYETVFGVDPSDVGDRIPFYDDSIVDSWRQLSDHIHIFDFSRIEYDVIGQIFEGLIGPEERHKYGQYYTRPEVVDVINAFCIGNGADIVMDPGCGGGTFLVRAYAPKRYLASRLRHEELLQSIYGIDQSRFATHLSTINLAARDLIEAQNYPRVLASDFFKVRADQPFMWLPGADGKQTPIPAPRLDAIVANPPYVRQEDIPKDDKRAYQRLVRSEVGLEANGRSDLHVYFWGHATSFLKPEGRLGFLTSSQWLDVEYGFHLQHFLLERFRIIAIIESQIEPWFVGARVQTAVTIACREADAESRNENLIRFVQIKRPIAEVLGSDGTSVGAIAAADEFRDTILAADSFVSTDRYRIRCVRQGDLLAEGEANGCVLRGECVYAGAKWGIPLRSPELWQELREIGGDRWKRLGELAEVARGLTTGNDAFFYVDDVTNHTLSKTGDPIVLGTGQSVPRADVISGRVKIVEALKGERWPIEAEYLEPVVHSLMHIDGYEVTRENCEHMVLMVAEPPESLAGTHVGAYIARGEALSVHRGTTVAARGEARPWYDLSNARRVGLFWAKSHQYRHCAPSNPQRYVANCNLYTVDVKDSECAAAVLNSSVVLLAKQLYGRPVGVESNLKTEVVDVNMMPVPDWSAASTSVRDRLLSNFAKMRERKVLGLLSERRLRRDALLRKGDIAALETLSDATEFEQEDRQKLDDAVLELLGVQDKTARSEIRTRLYEFLRDYFESARIKEELAIANKATAKRQAKLTPQTLANDIFILIEEEHPRLLMSYRDIASANGSYPTEGVRVPSKGKPEIVDDMLTVGARFATGRGKGELVSTHSRTQAELVIKVFEMGCGGRSYFLPIEEKEARSQIAKIEGLIQERKAKVRELVEARTSDPEIGKKAFELVMARF
jgi:type I restriction-modification system DNA methylase subunit